MSIVWDSMFRLTYAVLRVVDPILRRLYAQGTLGNVHELIVPGRRTGKRRSVLIGLLHAGDRQYLGHPNGHVPWTLNVEAAGGGELCGPWGGPLPFRAVRLSPGEERTAAIRATWQHPFPGNVIYRLGRGHIMDVGVYFRLEPLPDSTLTRDSTLTPER